MVTAPQSLAAQFAIEAKQRQRTRMIHRFRVLSLLAIVLLISASFIPDPALRHWVGLPTLFVLLVLKGFVSYQIWQLKIPSASDLNAF